MEKEEYKIAIYLRISKGDGKERESNSIQNQRSLLIQFIQSQREFDGCSILEFSDDGYSGITMNRPALIRLFEQVKEGKIACIMVKDFSRFSRDYIELGTYIEQIFPFLGVRFISLNNGYDSEKEMKSELSLELAFQNLFYDWYSKDLSIKVKSSLTAKKKKGCYISTRPPYGYKKDSKNPYQVVVCKEEAEIVKKIFSLALQGKTLCEIARLLNQKGILTQTAAASNIVLWRASTISQILKNPFYIGTMVYNKYGNNKAGGKSNQKTKEEWQQIFHHHPAIVEKEQFEQVQNRYKKKKKREKIQKKPHPFTGKLQCGICQKKLQIRNTKIPYFTCTTRYITDSENCVKRLEADRIASLIGQILYQIILFYQMQEKIRICREYCQKQECKRLQKKQKQIEKEQLKWNQKKRIKYQSYLSGLIKKEDYLKWNNQMQIQQKEWLNQQKNLQKKYDKIISLFKEKEIRQAEQNKREIQESAETLIKKIIVFDRKKIVIIWNFQEPITEDF